MRKLLNKIKLGIKSIIAKIRKDPAKTLKQAVEIAFFTIGGLFMTWVVISLLCMVLGLVFNIHPLLSLGGVYYTPNWVSPYSGLGNYQFLFQPWLDLVCGKLMY